MKNTGEQFDNVIYVNMDTNFYSDFWRSELWVWAHRLFSEVY